MSRTKWIALIAVELLVGLGIAALSRLPDADSEVIRAAIFFYIGFSLSTIILMGLSILSQKITEVPRRGGLILAGTILKFLFTLILLVIHLARGGFATATEGFVVIALYLVFSWLWYVLLKK
jgi:hypothetical protein